jgi:hypothetical protein
MSIMSGARDPVPALLAAADPALSWAVRHDLLGEPLDAAELWELPEPLAVAGRQLADGSWAYPGGRARGAEDYDQYATYLQLQVLVGKYRFDRRHPSMRAAAEYLLGAQTGEGDLRGLYGNQYSPNYTAATLALLLQGGYQGEARVEHGLRWLLGMRQLDGGWALPFRTLVGRPEAWSLKFALALPRPVEPDRAQPSSHLVTGIVLRALTAAPDHRQSRATVTAARLLASRFFTADCYPDRRDASYWTKFGFPFRWTDLVSSLDSVTLAGLGRENPQVARGLDWLRDNQGPDGLWRSRYEKSKDPLIHHWVSFAIARILNRCAVPEVATC